MAELYFVSDGLSKQEFRCFMQLAVKGIKKKKKNRKIAMLAVLGVSCF